MSWKVKHVGLSVLVSIIFIAFSLVSSNGINQYLRWQPLSRQHVNHCSNFLFSISTFVVTRCDSIFRFIAPATKWKRGINPEQKEDFVSFFFVSKYLNWIIHTDEKNHLLLQCDTFSCLMKHSKATTNKSLQFRRNAQFNFELFREFCGLISVSLLFSDAFIFALWRYLITLGCAKEGDC